MPHGPFEFHKVADSPGKVQWFPTLIFFSLYSFRRKPMSFGFWKILRICHMTGDFSRDNILGAVDFYCHPLELRQLRFFNLHLLRMQNTMGWSSLHTGWHGTFLTHPQWSSHTNTYHDITILVGQVASLRVAHRTKARCGVLLPHRIGQRHHESGGARLCLSSMVATMLGVPVDQQMTCRETSGW